MMSFFHKVVIYCLSLSYSGYLLFFFFNKKNRKKYTKYLPSFSIFTLANNLVRNIEKDCSKANIDRRYDVGDHVEGITIELIEF